MKLIETVYALLAERPMSGGALIEAIPLSRNAASVYGALARLAKEGRIRKCREGSGEVIWGVGDATAGVPRPAGPPESFRMGDEDLAWIEDQVWRMADGLPGHYFEELRRVVVARADRLAYDGAAPRKAAQEAVASLGTPNEVRRMLASCESGKVPRIRMRGRRRVRLWVCVLLLVAIPFLVRLFVLNWYVLPEWQISMAPTLVPGAEGGDGTILADLASYHWRDPRRGEIVVFEARWGAQSEQFVKRVLGLPGESVAVRQGDVFVDGRRLIKERRVLDAVAVPLFGQEGFERDPELPGLRQVAPIHTGFRLPDGSMEQRDSFAGDFVLRGTLRVGGLTDVVGVLIKVDGQPRHQVVFTASGYDAGVFVEAREIAGGSTCQLKPGRDYGLWITNADRLFRVELDGQEIARREVESGPGRVHIEIRLQGDDATARDLLVARDLTYATTSERAVDLAADEYFVLGDNSEVSRDSRQMGPVSRDAIVGRVWRVVWPTDRARLLTLPE